MLHCLLLLLAGCIETGLTKDEPGGEGSDSGNSLSQTEDTDTDTDTEDTDTEGDEACTDEDEPELVPPEVDDMCLAEPETGIFDPDIEWTWRSNPDLPGWNEVISVPLVANMTDDNGDGLIDAADIPDVVFLASSSISSASPAAITVVSGDGTGQHFSVNSVDGEGFYSQATPAVGDLDGDGVPEICAAGTSHTLVCLNADGTLAWAAGSELLKYGAPSIADLDADGAPEVVIGHFIYDNTGTEVLEGPHEEAMSSIPTDLDGDGILELVTGSGAFALDGTERWRHARARCHRGRRHRALA